MVKIHAVFLEMTQYYHIKGLESPSVNKPV